MQKDLENFSAMRKSEVSELPETSDSLGGNHTLSITDQSNTIKKLREKQMNIEEKEKGIAEQNLDKELDAISTGIITSDNLPKFLTNHFPNNVEASNLAKEYLIEYKTVDISVTESQLQEYISIILDEELDISSVEGVIILKEKLSAEGKSEIEILKTLIATYKNEPELKTFVENWNKFLELWKFAQDKPPTERKAIETIISNSNFTGNNSFDLALSEIESSADISQESKFEIRRKFKTTGINTVRDFDRTLNKEKQYKKSIEKKIQSRNTDIENLNDEISNLNAELKKLPPDDPKRSELKAKIKEKGKLLKNFEHEIAVLKKAKPNKIQFQLRNNLTGVLNPDGSRSIKIPSEKFTIQLPSNNLPLMGEKSLRSINVAFPYLALRSLHISNEIFAPDLVNNGVPTKAQRNIAHFILSSLNIDDTKILSEKDITQLKSDLSYLVDTDSGKTGRECLIDLGIYDVAAQEGNKNQLKKVLRFIRENRGNSLDFETLRLSLNK